MANKILLKCAGRLGLKDELTLRKADEFLRIYQSKATVKNLNDIAKSVLCLDLASVNTGVSFDKDEAIKLSGLKKQGYLNQLNTCEKILGLDKVLTISELCVQLSCTVAKDVAEKILEEYKNTHKKVQDFNHPQYPAVAVYTACKIKNVKPEKSRLITISRLKPTQWKELETQFAKFAESLGLSKQKANSKDFQKKLKAIDEETAAEETPDTFKKKQREEEEKVEEYEVWKERILRESRRALEEANKM